ncbi:MAG: TIGR03557 family F420-dependent LLM class oxidoreductase [Nitriliruptorales bacterium]|nr:TIGR03557 family F420-dependent LLM class oxidoreductase [Nitriliruptorales bacterium]
MPEIGVALSSEDHGPKDLVEQARMAEQAGFTAAWISDHYHPWTTSQGHSPFVWCVLGGIAAATNLRAGTGVTCPTTRIHPAIIAQAAATTAVMFDGRFYLGVGSGEALNEHILGDVWPGADIRLEMLEEAIAVLRLLWQGGTQSHYGEYYTVENAQVFDLPDKPPPIYISAFGEKALKSAARLGDGYVGTSPEKDMVDTYVSLGGRGPKIAGMKCCYSTDGAEARRLVHTLWPNMGLPGELAQILPTPAHFEQAAELVTEAMVADPIPTGSNPEDYIASISQFVDAGYDEIYIHNIGPHHEEFFNFFAETVGPQLP